MVRMYELEMYSKFFDLIMCRQGVDMVWYAVCTPLCTSNRQSCLFVCLFFWCVGCWVEEYVVTNHTYTLTCVCMIGYKSSEQRLNLMGSRHEGRSTHYNTPSPSQIVYKGFITKNIWSYVSRCSTQSFEGHAVRSNFMMLGRSLSLFV